MTNYQINSETLTEVRFPRPAWATDSRDTFDGVAYIRASSVPIPSKRGDQAPVTLALELSATTEVTDEAIFVAVAALPTICLDDVGTVDVDGARALIGALTELVAAHDEANR